MKPLKKYLLNVLAGGIETVATGIIPNVTLEKVGRTISEGYGFPLPWFVKTTKGPYFSTSYYLAFNGLGLAIDVVFWSLVTYGLYRLYKKYKPSPLNTRIIESAFLGKPKKDDYSAYLYG
jgi:hypothetical protein